MQEKGHDFNELTNLLDTDRLENEGKFIQFLKDANITISNTQNVTEHVKRNGKAFINLGKSASSLIEIDQILKRAGNSSNMETDLKALVDNFSKLGEYQKKYDKGGDLETSQTINLDKPVTRWSELVWL